jgi:hypothetical protein
LKLQHHQLLSRFPFNLKLRRYARARFTEMMRSNPVGGTEHSFGIAYNSYSISPTFCLYFAMFIICPN